MNGKEDYLRKYKDAMGPPSSLPSVSMAPIRYAIPLILVFLMEIILRLI
jgi:hypothetical protein